MIKTLFIVAPDRLDTWQVTEMGLDKPLSRFDDKDDAIDYATALAREKNNSLVKICNNRGGTEAELTFIEGTPIAWTPSMLN